MEYFVGRGDYRQYRDGRMVVAADYHLMVRVRRISVIGRLMVSAGNSLNVLLRWASPACMGARTGALS